MPAAGIGAGHTGILICRGDQQGIRKAGTALSPTPMLVGSGSTGLPKRHLSPAGRSESRGVIIGRRGGGAKWRARYRDEFRGRLSHSVWGVGGQNDDGAYRILNRNRQLALPYAVRRAPQRHRQPEAGEHDGRDAWFGLCRAVCCWPSLLWPGA